MNLEEFRKKVKRRAAENRQAFEGRYKSEIEGLLSLSKEEIDAITPDTTDMEVYSQLISVVQEASANNLAQADLKSAIQGLGDVGMSLAKRVPGLSMLLG